MRLDYYKPKNNLLKQYIEGYYFISEDKKSEQIKYYTFPNNFCILSINQKAKVELKENSYLVSSAKTDEISADIVVRYTEPIEVVYKNAVDEITIYFKPLGVNYFIDSPTVFKQPSLVNVIPFADFEEQMRLIFNQSDREIQIELLEKYWLSKFEIKNLMLMEQILTDIEADLKMEDIALKHKISRKHINTLFLKHIGKPPSEYRKIYRFRNALLEHKKSKNLTGLSHSSLFYDQSHFIKDFKTLTKVSPSKFFKAVDTEKENIWLFV
jgi:AraC-like DNA-binding protein